MTLQSRPYLAEQNDSILLIVDVQERLLNAFSLENKDRVVKNTSILAQSAQILSVPVIVTEQYPAGLGHTARDILDALPPGQLIHEKIDFSCCRSPNFPSILADLGRKTIIICGIEAHICVLQTVSDLLDGSYRVHVAADATGSRTDFNWQVGLSSMRNNGAMISSVETVVFQWLKQAGSDEFRQISRLVK